MYPFSKIEKKWQKRWDQLGSNKAQNFSKKPKYYALVEFPYPSGDGLHTGHVRSYTAMDVIARKRRMEGYNVLYPIGWDAFGLPTENYAIKTGIHPKIVTRKNTDTFRRQLRALGFSFDWDREVNTTDPDYYKWTQWIFLQFYKKGLAYKARMPINWCPSCKIGLANEEVIAGRCERCGTVVEQKEKEQWLLRITKYADRLLDDLNTVDYLDKIKTQQVNWIGRSEGAEIEFSIKGCKDKISVFTTRPDTLFGATYMVLAPEHKLVAAMKNEISNWREVKSYITKTSDKSEEERIAEGKEKTGVELKGIKAINPANKKEVPVFVADYVLASYGTGAIMAVPAHDERDWEFAKKHKLPAVMVICPNYPDKTCPVLREAYVGDGFLVGSGKFDGTPSEKAKWEVTKFVGGRKRVQYHLRDWIFSRQHYWGEPIPIIFCAKCGEVPVPEKDLPVKLPEVKKYQPTSTGESPLSSVKNWVNVKCPVCGGPAKRETDTMPNWAGSSWYFLRYTDPDNKKVLADPKKLKYWMPVDWYNGGMEHTTLHLLYSRFWNKFLYDIGVVPFSEPYKKRTSQGMVLGRGGEKMSKSKGNVVNPDSVVKTFGADTLRLYEMFMGPFDQAIPWDEKGLNGCSRFLGRVWEMAQKRVAKKITNPDLERALNKTVKKVGNDIESMSFNTAVSALMIFSNDCYRVETIPLEVWKKFLIILAPFAPHITEELWERAGNKKSINLEKWPVYNEKLLKEDKFELLVQVNGRLRAVILAKTGINEDGAKDLALRNENVKTQLGTKRVKKVVFVPNRLINFVV